MVLSFLVHQATGEQDGDVAGFPLHEICSWGACLLRGGVADPDGDFEHGKIDFNMDRDQAGTAWVTATNRTTFGPNASGAASITILRKTEMLGSIPSGPAAIGVR